MFNLKKRIKIYVAGPLGFTEFGRDFLYSKVIPIITDLGYQAINPWELTPKEEFAYIAAMPSGEDRRKAKARLNITAAR